MLIFASHRFRNRIIKTPEAAMTMTMMAPAIMGSWLSTADLRHHRRGSPH